MQVIVLLGLLTHIPGHHMVTNTKVASFIETESNLQFKILLKFFNIYSKTRLQILSKPQAPKVPNELLSNSDELESQANQAALKDSKDSKIFKGNVEKACKNSLQRQPAETACRDCLQRQPAKTESKLFEQIPTKSKRIQMNSKESK